MYSRSSGIKYKPKRFPRLQHPIAYEIEYAKYLKSIVEFTNNQIATKLTPRIPYLIRSVSVSRGDSYTDDFNEVIRSIKATVGEQFTDEEIIKAVKSRGLKISEWNRKQLTSALSSALSVDIYLNEPWLLPEINGFVNTNVTLIKSIPTDQLKELEIKVGRALRQGSRVEEIEKMIQGDYGVNAKAKNRSELIARDQVGKFNGDLNHMRQTSLGVTSYIWRTVRDERVRSIHAGLDGTVHKWSEPPVTSSDGSRNHPGEDFQCRCQPEPVLDF